MKFSESDAEQLIANVNKNKTQNKNLPKQKESIKNTTPTPLIEIAPEFLKKSKSPKIHSNVIIQSIQNSNTLIEYDDHHVTLAFIGARLLSLNEIFALLQYQSGIVFKYKKTWHFKVQEQLKKIPDKSRPLFSSRCKLTVFRQSSKLLDRDSLTVCFKYIIDALKYDPIKNPFGIILEDNPEIIFEDLKYQKKGSHKIGIRIDFIPNSSDKEFNIDNLFNNPQNFSDLQSP